MPEQHRKSLPSIRSQIALLVLACALPTVLGFGALTQQFYARERDTVQYHTRQGARAVAAAIDRDLVQTEAAAVALALSPSLHDGDLAAWRLQAGALLSPQLPAAQFQVSDAAGKAVMQVGPPAPAALSGASNARRLAPLFRQGRPQLSMVLLDGSALLAIDVPVFDDGRLVYALSAVLKPDRLHRILREQGVGADQALTLFDADGNIVAQAGGARLLLGQAADPTLRARLRQPQDALLDTTDTSGTAVYLALSRVPGSGATVALSTPQARATRELLQSLTLMALTLLAVLAIGFTLAWSLGGRIARSIRALVEPAQALAGGRAFTVAQASCREAEAVAQALLAVDGDLRRHRQQLERLVGERTSQLEKSRAQLETLYASAPVGLSYVDAELRVVRINDYLAALNQRPAAAHLGHPIGDMIRDPQVRQQVLDDYRSVLASGLPLVNIERSGYPAAAPQQLHHWVISYHPQFDGAGDIAGITALVLDVTAHRQVEAELQRSRRLLESVVDHIPAMIFLKRASDLSYEMFSPHGARMLGTSAEQMLGKNDYDFTPAEQADAFKADDLRVLATAPGDVVTIAEEALTTPTGTRYLTTHKVALRDEHNRATHVLGIAFDITERKQAREALAASERFVRTVTDNLPGMVAYWDAGLRCRFANRYFLDWHGMDAAQMLGARMAEVVGSARYEADLPYVTAALAGEAQGFAGSLQWPSGGTSHTWVNYIPDRDDDGAVKGFFVLVSDVTELKETELHLQHVNEELIVARDRAEAASRAKSEFLANMSHEIRTPMNAIIGLARLLEEAPLAPRERGYLHKIHFATQSLLSLVNDVLDFSRVEAGQLVLEHAPFRLQHILDGISAMLSGSACDKGIELVYDIDPALPDELAGDPMRLQQVLLNLVSNAIKFTEHGEVVLSARAAPVQPVPGRLALELRVRDTGIGIPADKQASIFDAFSQADSSTSRKFGGVGLGLAICRQLAAMMGGSISVSSEPGRGAEFLFVCPLATPAATAQPATPVAATLSVLVVDDNASVRHALQQAGRSFGWHTATAAGAAQALALLQQRAAAGQPYDLLLLDRDMPGTDGPTLLQQLPAGLALPPVLMMTWEHLAATLAQRTADLGLAGVLAKPVSPARLLERVNALLTGDHAAGSVLSQLAHVPLQGRLRGMRVLLVEDNEINQEVAEYMLQHAGASVDVAANGLLAVERLAGAPERYDVVLMDIQMPVLNGYDATRAIRAQGLLTLPIIAMTANVLEDDRRRAAAAGMNAHVAKPIDVEELISVLTRLVTIRDTARDRVAPAPAAALMPPISPLPGIDVDAALARLGGNQAALVNLLKRFERAQGGAVTEVRSLLTAGQHQLAAQVLHRLRGVAANLGAADVARLTATAEAALHDGGADALAMPAALSQLQQALELVLQSARDLATPQQEEASGKPAPAELTQQLAELHALLQNHNLKALDVFRALRPALGDLAQAQALAEAVEALNFKAARLLVEQLLQRKESP